MRTVPCIAAKGQEKNPFAAGRMLNTLGSQKKTASGARTTQESLAPKVKSTRETKKNPSKLILAND